MTLLAAENYPVVAQEHSLGCAVACVASRCGLPYGEALKLFDREDFAWKRGYYCPEVVQALERAGLRYTYAPFDPALHSGTLSKQGTIVFVEPSERFPVGHYLVRTPTGWMNPWANHPQMLPVVAVVEPELPGAAEWVLVEQEVSA